MTFSLRMSNVECQKSNIESRESKKSAMLITYMMSFCCHRQHNNHYMLKFIFSASVPSTSQQRTVILPISIYTIISSSIAIFITITTPLPLSPQPPLPSSPRTPQSSPAPVPANVEQHLRREQQHNHLSCPN